MVKRRHRKHTHEVRFGICEYHLCKRRTKVERCIHCGKFFCIEHLHPISPTFVNFNKDHSQDYEKWRQENGHPCPDYYDYLIKKKERESDEYGLALDRMSSQPIRRERRPSYGYYPQSSRNYSYRRSKSRIFFSIAKKGAILSFIIVIAYLFLANFNTITNSVGNFIEEANKPVSSQMIETAIYKYTNIERVNAGVAQLKWDEQLAQIAREHSTDMATNNFFSHDNLRGEDPTDRAVRHGYPVNKNLGGGWTSVGIGENIGKMPVGDVIGIGTVSKDADSIANAQVKSWMQSAGHRENLLNPQYDVIGVGVAYDGHDYIATQDFK